MYKSTFVADCWAAGSTRRSRPVRAEGTLRNRPSPHQTDEATLAEPHPVRARVSGPRRGRLRAPGRKAEGYGRRARRAGPRPRVREGRQFAAERRQDRRVLPRPHHAGGCRAGGRAARCAGELGPFTVFAPTNAAFGKLPKGTVDDLLKPENNAQLRRVLYHHVITSVYEAGELQDGQALSMVDGAPATISGRAPTPTSATRRSSAPRAPATASCTSWTRWYCRRSSRPMRSGERRRATSQKSPETISMSSTSSPLGPRKNMFFATVPLDVRTVRMGEGACPPAFRTRSGAAAMSRMSTPTCW